MIKDKKILAVIPARGGSKGLPGKNIKELCGNPLIAYAIEASLASKYIDTTVVSTDCENIRRIAIKYGAEAPFLRPAEFATDSALTFEVLKHALDYYKQGCKETFDIVIKLHPTSPLRLTKDIEAATELLFSKNAKAVVSVCKSEHNPLWANTLSNDGSMKDFLKPKFDISRQELPLFFRLNGAVYIAYCDYLIKHKGFFGPKTFAYIMPQERSVDIDTEFDFKIAELLLCSKTPCKTN